MDFSGLTLFGVMKSKLGYLSERQSTLAQNVANADTPEYKAKDVKEPDFKRMVQNAGRGIGRPLPMITTDGQHITQSKGKASEYKIISSGKTDELNPNGNNVVIEEEMSKIAMNQSEYQKVLGLYGKTLSMFKTAIGNPNPGA